MNDFDPIALAKLADDDPEAYNEIVDRLAREIQPDDALGVFRSALASMARDNDGLVGFEAYYELIHGSKLIDHNVEASKQAFEAFEAGEIFLYIGFRGCRKTSTFDVTLCSFLLGHNPEKTGIVTGANDPNAKLIAKSIAQIIEHHPEFRLAFPHVVPDKDRGWGAEGYWVMDNRKSREEWTQQQAKVNDPSFVGGGYRSSEINGKHPSLFLAVDDLHDIDSSSSVVEREQIKNVFLTQILPTVIRENNKLITKIIMTGVPFSLDDTYEVLRQSGGVKHYYLPVMRKAPEGEGVYISGVNENNGVVYDDIEGWWYLTWPENFGTEAVMFWRSKGKSTFWQMFMLDINVAKTAGLKYYLYDHKELSFNLPMVGGADPTNVQPDKEVGGQKRSSFALCHLGKLPTGGAVVVNGFLKPCGITEAKDAILQAQTMYPGWRTTGVENTGGGSVFLQYLRTDNKVRVQDSNLKIQGRKGIANKQERFNLEVSPWLENAVIRISDQETPYLMALRRPCDNFFDLDKHDEAWDAGDALYHAAKLIPEILRTPNAENLNPQRMNNRRGLYHPMAGALNG